MCRTQLLHGLTICGAPAWGDSGARTFHPERFNLEQGALILLWLLEKQQNKQTDSWFGLWTGSCRRPRTRLTKTKRSSAQLLSSNFASTRLEPKRASEDPHLGTLLPAEPVKASGAFRADKPEFPLRLPSHSGPDRVLVLVGTREQTTPDHFHLVT